MASLARQAQPAIARPGSQVLYFYGLYMRPEGRTLRIVYGSDGIGHFECQIGHILRTLMPPGRRTILRPLLTGKEWP